MVVSKSSRGITNFFKSGIVLFPLVVIVVSEILIYIDPELSSILKVSGVFLMLLLSLIKGRFHVYFILALGLFLPFFIYGIFHSFNIEAAIYEGIRYLFPIIVLLYSYSIKSCFRLLLKSFIVFILINNIAQIFNYYYWLNDVNQWFYLYSPNGGRYFNASSGIIRATGIVGFFGLFGFINLIGYFLIRAFYTGKRKKLLLTICLIAIFLSFSYKTIGALLLLLFIEYKNKFEFFVVVSLLFIIALISIPETIASMGESVAYRLQEYVIEGDSARGESYRIMFMELLDFNLFGRGVGSFGGPESVTYNSPIYDEVDFNWYSTTNLKTTDTYYPHLFVEMGLIGGLLYLMLLLVPLFLLRWKKSKFIIAFIIYFALFSDSLFSYSLNNILFLISSLLFIYPLFYDKRIISESRMDENQDIAT